MVYLCGRPLAQPRAVHARTRDRDSADDMGRGWLAAHDDGRRHSGRGGAGAARSDAAAASTSARSRGVRRRHAADRVPMAAIAVARRVVQPPRAEGPPASLRSRDDRQPLRAGARRPPSTVALLQRRRRSWSSSREHFQQMAGLVCYYNSSKFHYFYVSRDEESGKHLRVMSALPDHVTSDAFTPPIADRRRRADRAACRSGLRAAALRVSHRRKERGSGCRSSSTPASSRTRPARRGCRTSPGRSSEWPVRISRARRCRRTSTGSSTASASTSAMCRAWTNP